MITVNDDGLIKRDQFNAGLGAWTDAGADFSIVSGELSKASNNWTNVGGGATGGAGFYQDIASLLTARYGIAVQINLKFGQTGNFAGVGIFGSVGADSSFYLGFSTVNHMELTRYVGGSATNQDLDSTLTGVTGTWYTVRMTIAQNGSNVDLRGLAYKGLTNGADLSRDLTQYVALTNMAHPTANDLLGVTSWRNNLWDEVIVMGRPSNGGAITMDGLPTGYKLKIDGHAAVTESGGTATIPMSTWETYAFPSTTVYVLNAASEVIESKIAAVYGGADLTYSESTSTGLRADYMMTVYDSDDDTILTPQHPSAPHSAQFVVTTAPDWSGEEIMSLPRGRNGSLDVLSGVTDTGAISITLLDRKIATDLTDNAQRWVTAFCGNAKNVSDFCGLKVKIEQRIIDSSGTTIADWFTGRIDSVQLGKKNTLVFRIRDMADDLKYKVFIGLTLGENSQYITKASPEMNSGEAAYVSYGSRPMLAPIGLAHRTNYLGGDEAYGDFITQRWMKGTIELDADNNRFIRLDLGYTPKELRTITGAWPGVSDNPRMFKRGLVSNPLIRIRVRRDADSSFGEFHWGIRALEAGTWQDSIADAISQLSDSDTAELILIPLRQLDSADGDYKAAADFSAGNVVYCYLYSIDDPSKERPLYIDDVHPVTLFKDLLAGKWGMINIDGSVRRSFPYDSTSFTALEADATIPTGRWIIDKPEDLNKWVEDNICKPYQIGYRLNESGEVVVFRTNRLQGSGDSRLSGAPTIDSDDVVAAGNSGWEQTRDDAVNLITYKSYEEDGPTVNITGDGNSMVRLINQILENAGLVEPRHLTPVVQAENKVVYLLAEDATLKLRSVKKHTVDMRGMHTGFGRWEVNAFGVHIVWAEAARAWTDKHKETIKAMFSHGPISYAVTCLRTTATASLYPGDWAQLQIPDQLDPANAQRGGARYAMCTERNDNGLTIDFRFLDGGPSASSTAPSLNAVAQGTNTKHWVDVPIDYSGFGAGYYRVVVEYALTDTATGTRPAEGHAAWRYATNHTAQASDSVETVTLKDIPSNTRVWIRARTEPADMEALPSAWVFPSGAGYVDTAAYTAPTAISVDTSSFGGGIVSLTITLGESDLETEIHLAESTCPAGSYQRIKALDAGSNYWVLAGVSVSTTYCVGARHRDQFGGFTTLYTQQFTTGATKSTAPVMADVAVVYTD